jgi:hypothetical protein
MLDVQRVVGVRFHLSSEVDTRLMRGHFSRVWEPYS